MADPDFRRSAEAGVHLDPVGEINGLVDELRTEGPSWVPYIAPTWGGIDAEVLVLLRDPGPMTNPDLKGSGFLSAENDDDSARRLAWLLDAVGLEQRRCTAWNAYPWYINRLPRASELERGVEPLRRVLGLLPELRAVLLCGDQAQDSWRRLSRRHPTEAAGIVAISTFHTSNQAFIFKEPMRSQRKLQQLLAFDLAARAVEGDH
jgi:hypothetical protein